MLPYEGDSDSWLELLRDGHLRQLREENEYPEPPPFHRAIHYSAEAGAPCPAGKYPKQALQMQLQLLLKFRAPEGGAAPGGGKPVLPGGKGNVAAALAPLLQNPNAAAALQQLIQAQQAGKGASPQLAQQGQLLIEAAKVLAAAKAAQGGAGKGMKGGYGFNKGKGKGIKLKGPFNNMGKAGPY